MISPEIYIMGYKISLPGSFLIAHNIALWRVMARFFIPLHVVLVVFAAYTLWVVIRFSKIIDKIKKNKSIITTSFVAIVIALTACEYWTTVNKPSFDFNKQASGYVWLKKQSDIKVIAEFPMVDPLDSRTTDYVTEQVYHDKKLVNIKETSDRRQSNTLGDVDNPEAIDLAYDRGAQAVITHKMLCKDYQWGTLVFKDDSDMSSAMCIYRFNSNLKTDKTFVLFDKGIAISFNQQNSSILLLNALTVSLHVTGDDLSNSGRPGNVALSTELDYNKSVDINGNWKLVQNNRLLVSGTISSQKTKIEGVVDRRFGAEIIINLIDNRPTVTGDFVLVGTKATNL
jgi:hypothetical protein